MEVSRSEVARDQLVDKVLAMGDFFPLKFTINAQAIEAELQKFAGQWIQYNPSKTHIRRQGLSITSLTGAMDGVPDLHSLAEYHRQGGSLYRESDFRAFTPVYHHCKSLHPLLSHFSPDVGRSHFLRFQAGGYFPPHRDGAMLEVPDTFRIVVPIQNVARSQAAFLLDDRRLSYLPGSAYFVNTLLPHSLFAFDDDVIFLILNVVITDRSVHQLLHSLPEGLPWS
jgi:hypothetical protein